MQSETSRILMLLDYGQITLAEAEAMLDSALGDDNRISPFKTRIRRWLAARLVPTLTVALLAGVAIEPALTAALRAIEQVIGGTAGLQLIFSRLLEAFL
jgi:hypothetical protein